PCHTKAKSSPEKGPKRSLQRSRQKSVGHRTSGLGAESAGKCLSLSANKAGSSNSHQRPPLSRKARVSKPAPNRITRRNGSSLRESRIISSIIRCRATLPAAGPRKRSKGLILDRVASSLKRAANVSPQTGEGLAASAARRAQQ